MKGCGNKMCVHLSVQWSSLQWIEAKRIEESATGHSEFWVL